MLTALTMPKWRGGAEHQGCGFDPHTDRAVSSLPAVCHSRVSGSLTAVACCGWLAAFGDADQPWKPVGRLTSGSAPFRQRAQAAPQMQPGRGPFLSLGNPLVRVRFAGLSLCRSIPAGVWGASGGRPLRPSCPNSSTPSRPYEYLGCHRCKQRPAGTTECRGKIRNSIWR
jgi:hypothetical protein